MHSYYVALWQKEWIKLRYVFAAVPLLLMYAMADSYFTLNTIERVHEAVGLWTTLIVNEPPFFSGFQYIVFAGFGIGLFQMWPETHGKNIRLLYHLPLAPRNSISFMLGVGLGAVLCVNALCILVLCAVMGAFHLAWEIQFSVICAFLPFAVLNFISYLTVFAFLGCKKLGLRLLVILACIIYYSLLWGISGYSLWREALHWYALLGIGFVFLSLFTFLQVMGEPEKDSLYTVSKIGSLLMLGVLFCAVLPSQYWRVYMPKVVSQRLFYSPVHKEFVRMQTFPAVAEGVKRPGVVYSLENGTVLEKREIALALPTLRSDDLLKWNMFPKEIDGKALTLQQIKYDWQYFNLSPRDINVPPLLLEMMLEAQPDGASLEAPVDVFRRAHDGLSVEFIRPEDGQVKREKSDEFTNALRQAGFQFPIMGYGGNPNVRKEYDAGYVFVDAKGQAFQLQMVKGKARCAAVEGQVTGQVRKIIVSENRRKEFFAFIVTTSGIYAVKHAPLSLVTLPLQDFSPDEVYFYLWADPLGKNLVQGSYADREKGVLGNAFTEDFELKHTYTLPMREQDVDIIDYYTTIAAMLFPFRVVQRSTATFYYEFKVEFSKKPLLTLAANALCVFVYLLLMRARKKSVQIIDGVFIALFGFIGLTIWALMNLGQRRVTAQ